MAGVEASGPPFRVLWSQLSTRGHRGPVTLGMICPKSWHESLAQVGSARGPPPGKPPPGPRGQQSLVREGGPLAGLHGTRGEGLGGLLGAGRGER